MQTCKCLWQRHVSILAEWINTFCFVPNTSPWICIIRYSYAQKSFHKLLFKLWRSTDSVTCPKKQNNNNKETTEQSRIWIPALHQYFPYAHFNEQALHFHIFFYQIYKNRNLLLVGGRFYCLFWEFSRCRQFLCFLFKWNRWKSEGSCQFAGVQTLNIQVIIKAIHSLHVFVTLPCMSLCGWAYPQHSSYFSQPCFCVHNGIETAPAVSLNIFVI